MGNHNSRSSRASIGDYAAYGIYRVMETILRLLPMEVVCAIGSGLGQAGYFLMHRRRSIVMRNLRIAYGENLNMPEIRALTRKTFRHSGLNLMASMPASVIDNDELKDRVEVEGLENLHHALRQNKGCILLLAHMGNWEILTQLKVLAPEIQSLASLYRPLNNPLLDRLIKRRRQRKGAILFSKYDSFTKPITHIKQGGTLGCIADQNAGSHGTALPLFGKTTSMTSLPALLHRKTKAPILPISMITVGLGQWKVIFHPSITVSEAEKKNTYLLTALCAKAYERIMSESPTDVLWMHGYWKVGRKRPLKIDGTQQKIPQTDSDIRAESKDLKPFRILVYLGNTPATNPHISSQLGALVNSGLNAQLTLVGLAPEHPFADHVIAVSTNEPPHLPSNAIARLDQALPTPFDCAFDFTDTSSGALILQNTGISPIFSLYGKYQNDNTGKARERLGNLSLRQFLENLGLSDQQS